MIVAVSAPHREEAFAGAREAIDAIKEQAPIWKREDRGGGGVEGRAPAADYERERSGRGREPRRMWTSTAGRAWSTSAAKQPARAVARARARLRMTLRSRRAVRDGSGPKGEVLAVARIAGIQAAKQTAQSDPPGPSAAAELRGRRGDGRRRGGPVELDRAEARTTAGTGVEMEAMTAAAVAALTVYDMVKGLERGIEIEQVVLLEKRGGRSDYSREDAADARPEHVHTRGGREQEHAFAESRPRPTAALITISSSKARGEGSDESGPRLAALAERLGAEIVARELIGDDRGLIEARLQHLADSERCSLVLSSGGTGVAASDVTPEATAAVVERTIPGLAEAIRAASRAHTANWMLSRAMAGVRGSTLIVNLPGNPASIEQLSEALLEPLGHALELIAGRGVAH